MSWFDDLFAPAGTKSVMVTQDQALPGRDAVMPVPDAHYVNGHPLRPPFPDG
ncbi:peptide-methionine (S)-S-oxide reductase, partial [Rhodococcus hoagii]|nr:peptide-methionine (S)-S-oxide reductase [Prescottella equi]